MKKGIQISFAIIFLILGVAISLQYKSAKVQKEESKDIQEVQAELIRQKNASENLLAQIEEYKKKVENYEKNIDVEQTLKNDLEKARIFAGIEDVEGVGIEIDIDDTNSADELLGIVTPGGYSVSDINILEIINELRAAGAQAISINDERVVATSEIRRAGIYIRINNKNYNSPFKIKAIGEPTILEGALKIREGIVEYLIINGVKVSIEQKDDIEIPRYKGGISTSYLRKK